MIVITKGTAFYHIEYYYDADGVLANVASTTGTKLVNSAGDVLTPSVTNMSTGKYSISFATTSLVIGTPYTLILVGDSDIKSYPISVVAQNATPAQVGDIPSVSGLALEVTAQSIKTKTDAIPASPASTGDVTSAVTGLASQTSVNAIPTNPLLTSDARLNNLDATISSRSTLTAQQVWEFGTRTLSSFGFLVSSIWSNSERTLTSSFPTVPTASDNATATRTELSVELARIDATISSRLVSSSYTSPDNATITLIKTAIDLIAAGTTVLRANNSAGATIPTTIANLQSVANSLNTMIAANQFTEDALEHALSGGGLTDEDIDNIIAGLSPLGVTIVSPVVETGLIKIVKGDFYQDSRAITITGKTSNQWADLSDVDSIKFRFWKTSGTTTEKFEFLGAVVTATGIQEVECELDSSDTSARTPGWYNGQVVAIRGSDVETLWLGRLEISDSCPAFA